MFNFTAEQDAMDIQNAVRVSFNMPRRAYYSYRSCTKKGYIPAINTIIKGLK